MIGKAIRAVGLLCLPLVLLALVSTLSTPPANAADPQPVFVYQNPSGTVTASPTPEPVATTPAAVSASPTPTSGHPSALATPNANPIAPGSSSPDILKYALLTIGAAGAAGVILLIGYLVRRRVGYDPHREKPGGDDDHH